jgi:hypothetical protein
MFEILKTLTSNKIKSGMMDSIIIFIFSIFLIHIVAVFCYKETSFIFASIFFGSIVQFAISLVMAVMSAIKSKRRLMLGFIFGLLEAVLVWVVLLYFFTKYFRLDIPG